MEFVKKNSTNFHVCLLGVELFYWETKAKKPDVNDDEGEEKLSANAAKHCTTLLLLNPYSLRVTYSTFRVNDFNIRGDSNSKEQS
jgi:hypothetical protein